MKHPHLFVAAILVVLPAISMANTCDVPGTQAQWMTDICMLENNSNDPKNTTVQQCVKRRRAPSTCELNVRYKREYCEVLKKNSMIKQSIDACVGDPAILGPSVKNGEV
jgi:hypothetical protein